MISNVTYDLINSMATKYVPDTQHEELHVISRDAWVELVVDLVNKGLIKPKLSSLLKCALKWEELLTTKYSRLN